MNMKRFMDKVHITDGCWEWTGCKQKPHPANPRSLPYGSFAVNRRAVRAHRVSYQFFNGHIPEGMQCLHRCDNPSCVNPAHLFIGDQAENMRDMGDKGRRVSAPQPGSRNPMARLSTEDVIDIFEAYHLRGELQRVIAARYGIRQHTVQRIAQGGRWAHLGLMERYGVEPVDGRISRGPSHRSKK